LCGDNLNLNRKPFYRQPAFWIGMAISVISLVVLFRLVDPRAVWEALKSADYRHLAFATLLWLVYLWLRAVRWRWMLGNVPTTLRVFHVQNSGFLLNLILPLRLGEPARAILIGRTAGLTVPQGLSTMVVERLLDVLVVALLLPVTLFRLPALPDLATDSIIGSALLIVVALAALVVMVQQRPRVVALARRLLQPVPRLNADRWSSHLDKLLADLAILARPRSGAITLLLSALVWLPMVFAYQSSMAAVGLAVDPLTAAFVMCAAAFSIAAPSSPGYIGVFHAGVTAAIVLLGLDAVAAASFAVLYHAANSLFVALMGIIGIWRVAGSNWRSLAGEIEGGR
jgi:uncharacterized protein (TIRG00374 family)